MSESTVRLISLKLDNVLGLKAVRINPDRTLVRIEGKNAAGKSAVLNGICWALGGKAGKLDQPVREGESKARAFLDFGELQVERKATAKGGGGLEVTRNGHVLASPQTILDDMWSQSVDPVAFIHATPKEQAETLKRLAGLDWAELDANREKLYAERTIANREAKAAAAKCDTAIPTPADFVCRGIAEIAKKQEEATEHNRSIDRASDEVDRWVVQVTDARERLSQANKEAQAAEASFNTSVAEHDRLRAAHEKMERVETGDLTEQIAEAQAHNDAIEAYTANKKLVEEAASLAETADNLTERIELVDSEKAESLRTAKFPLPELGLDDMGFVTLNGLPLSQASQAEQLRTGVALSLAENRPCRIIPIRDGSLLDETSLQQLNDLAVEHDAQVWLERVAEEPTPGAVFIQDGEVVA